jgi:hypothetical protein
LAHSEPGLTFCDLSHCQFLLRRSTIRDGLELIIDVDKDPGRDQATYRYTKP